MHGKRTHLWRERFFDENLRTRENCGHTDLLLQTFVVRRIYVATGNDMTN